MAKYEFAAKPTVQPGQRYLGDLPPAPAGSSYIDRDSLQPGLAIRVTGTGYKSFLFCYRSDQLDKRGKRVERRIEMDIQWQPGEGTLRHARNEAAIRRGKLTEQVQEKRSREVLSPREERRLAKARQAAAASEAQAERITAEAEAAKHSDMASLVHRYLEEHAKLKKRSWRNDERRLIRLVLPWAGTRKARDITRADIANWIAPIAIGNPEQGIKPRPGEANNIFALVRKLFSFAVDKGIVEHHPCLRMSSPGGPTPVRERALEKQSEFRLLWRITDGSGPWTKPKPNGRLRKWSNRLPADVADALRLVLLTGGRVQEVAGLTWSEVDMSEATWTLPKERSKNKRAHVVPLTEPALEILRRRQLPAKGKYVFPGHTPFGSLRPDRVAHTLKGVVDRLHALAKIDGEPVLPFTTHDLRRTVETGMAKLRIPKEHRDRVLNHVDNSVGGKNYNKHDYVDEKWEALERWAGYLESKIGNNFGGGNVASNVVPIRKQQEA